MMTAKQFSLTLIAGAALLFVSTVAANILLDPQHVFHTNLFPKGVNWNERAGKLDLYKRAASKVDGLIFSSSRGNMLPMDSLAEGMGVSHLFNLSVSYGMLPDHLPIFEYILADKAKRGQHIKAVMLLLDPDFFGKPAWTNSNINSFLPPELSGESPVRYWWRYLTVFQYRFWRDAMRSTHVAALPAAAIASQPAALDLIPEAARAPINETPESYRRSWNSIRPDLEKQMNQLTRFVGLCRENDIRLTVALSPLIRQNLDVHEPGSIEGLTNRISAITPVWNFNSPPLIADKRGYWLDFSHFDGAAGALMVNRMFGHANPPDFAKFGELLGAKVEASASPPRSDASPLMSRP